MGGGRIRVPRRKSGGAEYVSAPKKGEGVKCDFQMPKKTQNASLRTWVFKTSFLTYIWTPKFRGRSKTRIFHILKKFRTPPFSRAKKMGFPLFPLKMKRFGLRKPNERAYCRSHRKAVICNFEDCNSSSEVNLIFVCVAQRSNRAGRRESWQSFRACCDRNLPVFRKPKRFPLFWPNDILTKWTLFWTKWPLFWTSCIVQKIGHLAFLR